MAKKDKVVYVCQECGYESAKWLGKCPECGNWNSMVEEHVTQASSKSVASLGKLQTASPQKLNQLQTHTEVRTKTTIQEFNRVMGGGIVKGSLTLIGGDPGIGKSTLLLQVSAELAATGGNVLYVSGEESESQIKMRADRLKLTNRDFYVYPETDLAAIIQAIHTLSADYVIIDSIQTMIHPEIDSAAGSVSQVRETTAALLKVAKSNNISIFIVGHVTKQGSIAGPRILEHTVDTVLYFEGDQNYSYRILRAVKNRFGSTNEIGVFEMVEQGLKEVANPSQFFLEERLAGTSGSAIVVSMEGTRPILAEIQALITPTPFGNARRTAQGVDYSRMALIMAVLEKRGGLLLQNQDGYLKASGGVKLDEPAIDLAVAVAITSSYNDKQTNVSDAFVGELGLTGEVRRVSQIEERVKEAEKLGFKRIFIPKHNADNISEKMKIEVIGVRTIKETMHKVFS